MQILKFHIKDDATLPDITDKVYAMATTIEIRAGVKRSNTQHKNRKRENRRTKKMTRQIKELRQLVAQTANEIYRKKNNRKATYKEKKILGEIEIKAKRKFKSKDELAIVKEIWLDKLRLLMVKLKQHKEREKGSRIIVYF